MRVTLSISVQWQDYGLDGPWLNSQRGQDFSVLQNVQRGSGAHPASGALSLGAKWPRRERTLTSI